MSDPRHFDVEKAYDVDNYLYFMSDLVTEQLSKDEVSFFIQALGLSHNCSVLDLPCGHGRHSNLLASHVGSVTGVDISNDYLEIARNEARKRNVSVNYVHGDMRHIDLNHQFDAVLMVFTSFAMFDHNENVAVLRNMAKHLKAGGKFCIEIMNPSYVLPEFKRDYVFEKDGNLMIDRLNYDQANNRFISRRIYIKNGKRVDALMSHEMFSKEQLDVILAGLNMKFTEVFASCTGGSFTTSSHKMVLVGEKASWL